MENALNKRGSTGERQRTPDFENPPVVETSAGFHLSPIQGWTVLHYGLLWEKFKAYYPVPEFNPPVGEVKLQLNASTNFAAIPIRACFVDSSNATLVQVQNNLFLRNWRKGDATSLYQHYESTRDALLRDWHIFREFVLQQSLNLTDVVRCEMSYFNHLVRGEDWKDFSDLPKLYPAWRGVESAGVFSNPQMISIAAWFSLPKGTMQIVSQPALRQDGREIIQLTVTVTGAPSGQDDQGLFDCLDECHQAAVEGFASFTSGESHLRWQRIR